MFDTYSRHGNVNGVLIAQQNHHLLYMNTKVEDEETGQVTAIENGTSYELINGDDGDILSVNFEVEGSTGDGVSEALFLEILINRAQALYDKNPSETNAMYLRSLQLAKDTKFSSGE